LQLVIMLLIGSLILGMLFEKLDRKAYLSLLGLILLAAAGYYFFERFL
jgi:hypothetical protein